MNKMNVSASELKKNVAEILNSVYFEKRVAVIERYGKPIAEIVPIKNKKKSVEELEIALKETFGSLPDFPDVTKFRVSRRRKITL